MKRLDIEKKVNELSQEAAQMTADLNIILGRRQEAVQMSADLNVILGRREAYKEMLATVLEIEINSGNDCYADEVDETACVLACEQTEGG